MTDGMVARDALESKEIGKWGFARELVRGALLSSGEFAVLVDALLAGGEDEVLFERGLRRGLLAGTADALSAKLSAGDAERERPRCGSCGSGMVRRGTRRFAPRSLFGRLELSRGYWTCRCSKGGRHPLDEALGVAGRDGVRLTPAALWAVGEATAETGFAEAAERLGRTAELRTTAKRAERAAKRKVVVADGARWIWNVVSELFPGAVEIVDIWHAKERLWEVAAAVHGQGTDLCRAWAEKLCSALAELRRRAGNHEAAKCVGHVENNRERMRYPEFRAMGLLVGSGMVESACGVVVGQRLKRGGMRWSVAGANDVMALRTCVRNGRYDDFRRRRRERRLAA